MKRMVQAAFALLLLIVPSSIARAEQLETAIERLLAEKKADVGVAVRGIEDGYSVSVNGSTRYPLQSVFKFHIALAVLDQVDKGAYSLEQKIPIAKKDLTPKIWSPIRDNYPEGAETLTLADILRYTVAESDNNGCDILLRLIGGPGAVNKYIHEHGFRDFSVTFNEATMQEKWERQFSNWSTPDASAAVLAAFYKQKLLKKESFDFLWKVMLETVTGGNRIKGGLPMGTPVAHKTGTSGMSKGVTAAVNDIGIVTLPDGRHVAIAVFVCNSREDPAANEKIIADVTRLVWEHLSASPEQ